MQEYIYIHNLAQNADMTTANKLQKNLYLVHRLVNIEYNYTRAKNRAKSIINIQKQEQWNKNQAES